MADVLTVAQMRQALGSSPDATDDEVRAAFAAYNTRFDVSVVDEAAVDIDEVKRHLRIDGDDEDDELTIYRDAAIGVIEAYTGHSLTRRAFDWTGSRFARVERLPRRPVRSVQQLTFIDPAGNETQMLPSSWRVSIDGLIPLSRWPGAAQAGDAITVRYEAGYDDAMPLPGPLKVAVLMMAANLYRYRDSGDDTDPPAAIAALCRPYRRPVMA